MASPSENVSGASHHGKAGSARRRWPALLGLNAVFAVTMLDGTILYPALGAIRIDLDGTVADAAWLVAGYLLSFGALLAFCHRLTDRLGPRRGYVAGLVLLIASSALAYAAWSIDVLLLARALQGAAAALIAPAVLPLLEAALDGPPSDRRVLRIWAGIGALGGAIGLMLGGAIIAYLNWRWIFGCYLVVAVGALVLTRKLPALPRMRRAASPLAPWGLLRDRGVVGAAAVMLVVGISFDGTLYLLVLYGQEILGYPALTLSLVLSTLALASVAGSLIAQFAVVRIGLRALAAVGSALILAAALLLATVSAPDTFAPVMLGGLLLMGLGVGTAFVAAQITIVLAATKVPAMAEFGLADTIFAIGGAAGLIALAGVIADLHLGAGNGTGFAVIAAAAAVCTIAAIALLPRRASRP